MKKKYLNVMVFCYVAFLSIFTIEITTQKIHTMKQEKEQEKGQTGPKRQVFQLFPNLSVDSLSTKIGDIFDCLHSFPLFFNRVNCKRCRTSSSPFFRGVFAVTTRI